MNTVVEIIEVIRKRNDVLEGLLRDIDGLITEANETLAGEGSTEDDHTHGKLDSFEDPESGI